MTWDLLQTNWPYPDEQPRTRATKERWFVDHSGITVFMGNQEQCKAFRKTNGGIVRHYTGTSEEYRSQLREEKRYQWTGSGTKQTMAPDDSPGVIWLNGSCYKKRSKNR